MDKLGRVDCSRLLVFSVLNEQNMGRVDFQDDAFAAKFGAKIGQTEAESPLNFSRLLGFAGVADLLAGGIDFQDATISHKLGAKVGPVEVNVVTEQTGGEA